MSNALAIAAATAVLKHLLNNGIADSRLDGQFDTAPTVSALPPDRIKVGDAEVPQINLFFYHAAPNAGWRNVGLPSRNDHGDPVTNPPLALDLSYLLTAYGKNQLDCEILLGYAMQMLHETPVLPRDAIRKALGPDHQPPGLQAAGLADQVEQIKITPQILNTEEISKLWTAMQAHYRPSAAYQVSVVLIEGERPTRTPLPVVQRNVRVLPFRGPVVEEVTPAIATEGQTLTLRGRNLRGDHTQLDFGLVPLTEPVSVDDQTIVVTLPVGLLAGVHTVQVVQQINFGAPGDPHGGFESNAVPFILAPRITTQQPISVKCGETLTLDIRPPVGSDQRVNLLLGDRSMAIGPRPPGNPAATLGFPIPSDFPVGQVPLRVQIDGVQSQLDIDHDPDSPTFGQFTGAPNITITE
ncbi:MAG: DUF4255 domain-containing protein [Phycisphaerales bacterium]